MKLQFIGKNIAVKNALKEITAIKFEKLSSQSGGVNDD